MAFAFINANTAKSKIENFILLILITYTRRETIMTQPRRTTYYKHNGLEISSGNGKLPDLIFNMNPATGCIGDRLGLCDLGEHGSGRCYALCAERRYSAVLAYRRRQEIYWESKNYKEIVEDFSAILTNKRTRNKATGKLEPLYKSVEFLRISESGEFKNQAAVNKLDAVAIELKARFGLKIFCYTTRSDLEFKHVKFAVKGSGHDRGNSGRCDVKTSAQIKQGRVGNKYHEAGKVATICPGSCDSCQLCKILPKKPINIIFPLH